MKLAWPLLLVVAVPGDTFDVPEGLADKETTAPEIAVPEPSLTVTTIVAVCPTETDAVDPPFTVRLVCAGSGAVAVTYSLSLATMALELPL